MEQPKSVSIPVALTSLPFLLKFAIALFLSALGAYVNNSGLSPERKAAIEQLITDIKNLEATL